MRYTKSKSETLRNPGWIKYPLIITPCLLLAACPAQNNQDIQQKLEQLETKVNQLEAKNKALQKEDENLSQTLGMFAGPTSLEHMAILSPTDKGYAPIKADIGYLTVSISDITPYANGSKVILNIGNLTAAMIQGLKMKLDWGAVGGNGYPLNDSAKSSDFNFINPIPSGAWAKTEVILSEYPPNTLGFVRVSGVTHQAIALKGASN